jgi:hypothetical protein
MKHEFKFQFLLYILIVMLLLFISSKINLRFDFSKDKIYTLTDYTKTLFNNVPEKLTLTWICSDNIKKYFPTATYLEDILRQYALLNNCNFETVNSSTLSETALQGLNIFPEQIASSSRDEKKLINMYSALLIEYRGMTKVLPYMFDVQHLEYTIANNVLALLEDSEGISEKRSIYILASHNALKDEYQYLLPFLEYDNFVPIVVQEENIDDLKSSIPLIVVGSSFVTDEQTQMIDAFLQAGGNAAFFVSGTTIDVHGNWACVPKQDDKLLTLLSRYGFLVGQDIMLDIFSFPLTMTRNDGVTSEVITYPFWLRANAEQADLMQPFFAGYNTLQFYWPSSLDINTHIAPTVHSVLKTSTQAKRMIENFITDPFAFSEKDTRKLEKNAYTIAAVSHEKGKIFVMSDENFLSRCIEFTKSDMNIQIFVSVCQWLCNRESLLALKNKLSTVKPFKTFADEKKPNEIKLFARSINFILVPLMIVAMFLFKMYFQQKRRSVSEGEKQ